MTATAKPKSGAVGQVVQLATSKVKPMPGQPRLHFDRAELARLRDSIAKIGQQQPATVVAWTDGTYRLRDGERRWRCCRELDIPLMALIVDPRDAEEEFELATAANMNRASHSPLEKAMAMKRLRDGPLRRSISEIAQTFGVSDPTIYNHLKVVDELAPDVLALLDPNKQGSRRDTLPMSAAVRLTVLAGYPREQLRLAKKIVAEKLSLAQAIHLIDLAADKRNIVEGRGREQKPSDHGRSVGRAVRRLCATLDGLFKDATIVTEMVGGMQREKRQEFAADVQRAIERLRRLAEVAR